MIPGASGANLGSIYAEVELRLSKLEQGIREASRKIDAFGADTRRRTERMAQDMERSLGNVGRSITLGLGVPLAALGTAAIKTAANMDSLRRGLTAVAGSSAEAERQMKRLQEVAKLPGLGFREAIEGATRLQAAGMSARMAERSLMAFGNALATVGRGKADLEGVQIALSQIMAKGKLQGDELLQLMERLPQMGWMLKEAFGTANTEQITKMGMSVDDMMEKIVTAFEKLPKATGGAQNAFENLQDASTRALDAIGKDFLPTVARVADRAAGAIEQLGARFRGLPTSVKEFSVEAGASIVAAGGVMWGLSKVIGALREIRTLLPALGLFGKGGAIGWAIAAGGLAVQQIVTQRPGGGGPSLWERWAQNIRSRTGAYSGLNYDPNRMAQLRQDPLWVMRSIRDQLRRERAVPPAAVVLPPSIRNLRPINVGKAARKRSGTVRRETVRDVEMEELIANPELLALPENMEEYRQYIMSLGAEARSEQFQRSAMGFLGGAAGVQPDAAMNMLQGLAPDTRWRRPSTMFGWFGGLNRISAGAESRAEAARWRQPSTMFGWFGGLDYEGIRRQTEVQKAKSKEMADAAEQQLVDAMERLDDFKANRPWQRTLGTNLGKEIGGAMADELYNTFQDKMQKLFGRGFFGNIMTRLLTRAFDRLIEDVLDQIFKKKKKGEQPKSGIFGSLLGNVFGGTLGGVLGGLGGIFGFAEGGTAPARRFSIVGERGPELIYPAQPTSVQPLSAAGVGGVTINIPGVVVREEADIGRLSRRIAQDVQTALRVRS